MKRSLIALMVLLIPTLLFLNVFFAFRHEQLTERIELLEAEQRALIEANKRAILAISVLSSPDRIGELATEELGLERIDPERIERLSIGGNE